MTPQPAPARPREYGRHAWRTRLTVELKENCQREERCRVVQVDTLDLSTGGFSFVFPGYIHPGTVVLARLPHLADKPRLRGVVRTCHQVRGLQHRVGVEFVLSDPDEPAHPPAADRSSCGTG